MSTLLRTFHGGLTQVITQGKYHEGVKLRRNKKVIGVMKDGIAGNKAVRFVGLPAKSSYI